MSLPIGSSEGHVGTRNLSIYSSWSALPCEKARNYAAPTSVALVQSDESIRLLAGHSPRTDRVREIFRVETNISRVAGIGERVVE
jgi:hypothetical protein